MGDIDELNVVINNTGAKNKAPIISPIDIDCSRLAFDRVPAIHPPMNGPSGPDIK